MQKKTLLCTLLAAGTLFTACKKKDDNNTDQLASLGKATITGKVYAPLVDTAGASINQIAPANTVISAWIDTKDFVVNPGPGNYAKKYYTATVDANGNYKLTVDVSKYQPATLYITPQPFGYDQVKNTIGVVHHDSVYTEHQTFYPVPPSTMQTVYTDFNGIVDIHYDN